MKKRNSNYILNIVESILPLFLLSVFLFSMFIQCSNVNLSDSVVSSKFNKSNLDKSNFELLDQNTNHSNHLLFSLLSEGNEKVEEEDLVFSESTIYLTLFSLFAERFDFKLLKSTVKYYELVVANYQVLPLYDFHQSWKVYIG